MKKFFIIFFSLLSNLPIMAQDSFNEFREKLNNAFQSFKDKEDANYEAFRKRINDEYAEMVKKTWTELNAMKGIPVPKDDKPVPPVVFRDKDRTKPIKDNTKPVVEVVPVVTPTPQPQPVIPIKKESEPTQSFFSFDFLGSKLKVRLGESNKLTLSACDESSISKAWVKLSKGDYAPLISDCLKIRESHNYSDWAYLQMLKTLSFDFYKKWTNESVLLMAYIYCQSGYKMRLASSDGKLYMLFASKHQIYDLSYWNIGNEMYYPFECNATKLHVCEVGFPKETPMSLYMTGKQQFGENYSNYRLLQSKRYPMVKANVRTNMNLIDFYNSYPTSYINDDFGTRWAMYANTPLEEETTRTLYPSLKNSIRGLSQKESVERLLNFVQTAFEYEFDDKVWGQDRAFFSEESLYYPYCDCEDRSILFSRLVRDIVGLKVVLIYYPGHLASAVHFTESVAGDNVVVNGEKYVICDPTYIGAPVGLTMPRMDNSLAKVIMLK